eukprot:gnl/TRDRNA2_/TRDRNA2_176794_c0_seq3.p1 gnl/TRDRNA2_/TRDRNA2_176794_c0~~gnl/TRDRNA2_/TRDRNA2_176794_c0_seq3.p1  ORF type:complete len:461 (-),score=44.76 gnl/TRDRNA2_/TRDRNA2_176794_c0_seq3:325-1500(-)
MGAKILPMARRTVDELKFSEFDKVYLDSLPLILTGASICPSGVTLANVGSFCQGAHKFHVHNRSVTSWAGLDSAGRGNAMGIAEFVESTGNASQPAEHPPRYMFDLPIMLHCPELLTRITIPAHMFTTSIYHWDGEWENCSVPPHIGLFISERGFATSLHVDNGNTAFWASSCSGRKRWRVVTVDEFAQHEAEFKHDEGITIEGGRLIFASPKLPFDTWSPQGSGGLMDINVSVFEGVVEPGDLLYIPPGALHAAESLDDVLMFAANDHSFRSFDDLDLACKTFLDFGDLLGAPESVGKVCEKTATLWYPGRRMYPNRKAHLHEVKRTDKSFFEAFRCDPPEKFCTKVKKAYNEHAENLEIAWKWCRDKFVTVDQRADDEELEKRKKKDEL